MSHPDLAATLFSPGENITDEIHGNKPRNERTVYAFSHEGTSSFKFEDLPMDRRNLGPFTNGMFPYNPTEKAFVTRSGTSYLLPDAPLVTQVDNPKDKTVRNDSGMKNITMQNKAIKYHLRFNHLNDRALKDLNRKYNLGITNKDFRLKGEWLCPGCVAKRIRTKPVIQRPQNQKEHPEPGELAYCDIGVNHPEWRRTGLRYTFYYVEATTNWTQVYHTGDRTGADVAKCEERFAMAIRVKFKRNLKTLRIRSDNAKEFIEGVNRDQRIQLDIYTETATPGETGHVHIVEACIHVIESTAHALIEAAKAPLLWWHWAIDLAVFSRNMLPHGGNTGTTSPYELMTGRKYDLTKIKTPFATVFARIDRSDRTNSEGHRSVKSKRFRTGIYVGKAEGDGYIIHFPQQTGTLKTLEKRDLIWDETLNHTATRHIEMAQTGHYALLYPDLLIPESEKEVQAKTRKLPSKKATFNLPSENLSTSVDDSRDQSKTNKEVQATTRKSSFKLPSENLSTRVEDSRDPPKTDNEIQAKTRKSPSKKATFNLPSENLSTNVDDSRDQSKTSKEVDDFLKTITGESTDKAYIPKSKSELDWEQRFHARSYRNQFTNVMAMATFTDPKTHANILRLPPDQTVQWIDSERRELEQMRASSTSMRRNEVPPNERIFPMVNVYTTKLHADGSVNK
jgi:hypothetical protein